MVKKRLALKRDAFHYRCSTVWREQLDVCLILIMARSAENIPLSIGIHHGRERKNSSLSLKNSRSN